MQRVSATELRRFLLDRLGLAGPLREPIAAAALARDLGMIQIDSIRVTGLRNHELAWLARAEATVPDFYAMVHGRGEMVETHFPVFVVRRDWVPTLSSALLQLRPRDYATRRRIAKLMDSVEAHIRANGPAGPADFQSRRVVGGFNTIKATTRALEYLFMARRLQISGRTAHFHRLFDLTERCLPELAGWRAPETAEYERFLLISALKVLKVATARQWADRVALHFGSWRGESIKRWRTLVEAEAPKLAIPVQIHSLPDNPVYWHLPEDAAGWEAAGRESDPETPARILPPLDNLLFNRERFAALFGHDYKFEAYTPIDQRRFYFAMPVIHGDRLAALIDVKRDQAEWRIVGFHGFEKIPAEAFRAAAHRLAAAAGAARVTASTRLPRELRRAAVGKIETENPPP